MYLNKKIFYNLSQNTVGNRILQKKKQRLIILSYALHSKLYIFNNISKLYNFLK